MIITIYGSSLGYLRFGIFSLGFIYFLEREKDYFKMVIHSIFILFFTINS